MRDFDRVDVWSISVERSLLDYAALAICSLVFARGDKYYISGRMAQIRECRCVLLFLVFLGWERYHVSVFRSFPVDKRQLWI